MKKKTGKKTIGFNKKRYTKKFGKNFKNALGGKYTRTLVCNTIGGFPDRYYAKLKCVTEPNALAFNVSGTQGFAIKLNSLLTPVAGGGVVTGWQNFVGQPTGTGIRQAIYCNYVVHACKIKIMTSVEVSSTSNLLPRQTIVPLPSTISTTTVTAFDLAEMARAVTQPVNPNIAGGQNLSKPLVAYYNLHDIIGLRRKDDLHLLDNLFGDITNNPSDTRYAFFQMSTDTAGTADTTLAVRVNVEATYYVEFFNRNMQFIS